MLSSTRCRIWQAVTVLFHSTILSGCRITSWYTSSAGQGRKVFKMKVLPWKGTSMVYTVSPYSFLLSNFQFSSWAKI